jgi:hypothetical protein
MPDWVREGMNPSPTLEPWLVENTRFFAHAQNDNNYIMAHLKRFSIFRNEA